MKTIRKKFNQMRPASAVTLANTFEDEEHHSTKGQKARSPGPSPTNTMPKNSLSPNSGSNKESKLSPTNTLSSKLSPGNTWKSKSPFDSLRSNSSCSSSSPNNSLRGLSNFTVGSPVDEMDNFQRLMRAATKGSSSKKKKSWGRNKTIDASIFGGGTNPFAGMLDDDEASDLASKIPPSLSFQIDHTSSASLLSALNDLEIASAPMSTLPPLEKTERTMLSNVVKDFGSKADINQDGLKKGKKEKITIHLPGGGKKKGYQMEDTHLILCPYSDDLDQALFGVFDGHVDKNAAHDAKELFPTVFAFEQLREKFAGKDMKNLMKRAFKLVDDKMSSHQYEGCTATVVYMWAERGARFLQCGNVGDSTAYMWRNGEAVCLSEDHKPNTPKEIQRLRDAGIDINEGQSRLNGLAVSRSLGDHFAKENGSGVTGEPYVTDIIAIQPSDSHVVIASDGLWDVISGKRALEIVRMQPASTPASELAKKLVSVALESGRCKDNITVIVITL